MPIFNHCDSCITNKSQCRECADNPIYKDIPRQSFYQEYIPTCPRGYEDCVNDPAYIKCNHSEWYKKTFGDMTPEQAAEQCRKAVEEDPDEEYYCYDNEDK